MIQYFSKGFVFRYFSQVINIYIVVVLDTNQWYHQTYIVGQEISITIGSEYD